MRPSPAGYLVIFEKDFKRNYVHLRYVADCFAHCMKNAPRMVGRCYSVGLDSANLSTEELALRINCIRCARRVMAFGLSIASRFVDHAKAGS